MAERNKTQYQEVFYREELRLESKSQLERVGRAGLPWDSLTHALEKLDLLVDGKLVNTAPLFFGKKPPGQDAWKNAGHFEVSHRMLQWGLYTHLAWARLECVPRLCLVRYGTISALSWIASGEISGTSTT